MPDDDDNLTPEDDSLRDSLSEAFEKSESTDVVNDELSPGDETSPAPKTETPPEKTDEIPEKPAAGAAKLEIPTLIPAEGVQGTVAAPKVDPAPPTWKPGPREHWEALPADVKAEIGRREQEISVGLRDSADSRKLAADFKETIAPFQHFIQAENSTPLQAVSNMMRTAAVFRTGTAQQKAQTAASIIKNFGIDIQMLDGMLAGSYQEDPVQRQIETAVAPYREMAARVQNMERERNDDINSSASQSIEAFGADPKNEFFHDVRETMADILDLSTQRGQAIDLPTAYNRAIMMHDDIAAIVAQRNVAANISQRKAPAQRARAKAVSVQGAPEIGDDAPKAENLRDDIVNAIEAQMDD